MCAAESGEKVIERDFVSQVDDGKAQAPFVTVAVEEIVLPYRDIEQAARLDSLRIVVVVFFPWCWDLDINRSELICRAGSEGGPEWTGRRTNAVACEPTLVLLVSSQR
jgi:hypothetical protein